MNPVIVRVTHRFDATPERVFDAWLDPDTAGRWLFATADGQMQRVQILARVGGRYAIVERRPNGDAGHFGRYLEIERPHRLVFTLAMAEDADQGNRITVEITAVKSTSVKSSADGNGSLLTLTHEMAAEHAQYAKPAESGWTMVLAALDRHLA